MPETVFGYPGGKYYLAEWIIDHFPQHNCYVEPFGGSGVVLLNKDPSTVEVYNDLDNDLVQFFDVLRNSPDELKEWLRAAPHSRSLHDRWASAFYEGYRPDDDIERAGRFFYLRFTQFGGKYTGVSGYNGGTKRNMALKYANKREALSEFARRFDSVEIENLDYATLVERYDAPDTLWYCDPPYVKEGDALYSHEGGFDHERFTEMLEGLEGRWIVSYTDLPPSLREGYWYAERGLNYRVRQGHDGWEKENTERLVMNFDPTDTPAFSAGNQQLTAFATDGGSQ